MYSVHRVSPRVWTAASGIRVLRLSLSAVGLAIVAGCAVTSLQTKDEPGEETLAEIQRERAADFEPGRLFRAVPATPISAGWSSVVNLKFAGSYRAQAKTSYAMKSGKLVPFESFTTVGALVKDLNAPNGEQQIKADYRARTGRALGAGNNNEPRMEMELRNVRLTGFIRAVKWVAEEDQDFHVMICQGATGDGHPCFTTEVSGLPNLGDTQDFRRARTELISVLQNHVAEYEGPPLAPSDMKAKWAFFDPGVHVEVSGSLYLDAIHNPGSVGPRPSAKQSRDHTTPTAWEIHPVYSVRALQ